MNDEQILEAGGTEEDIKKYAEQNGANLSELDILIESGIAEFDEEFKDTFLDGPYYRNRDFIKAFIASLATNVHNAAIEATLEALPKPYLEVALDYDNQTQEVKDFIGKLINA